MQWGVRALCEPWVRTQRRASSEAWRAMAPAAAEAAAAVAFAPARRPRGARGGGGRRHAWCRAAEVGGSGSSCRLCSMKSSGTHAVQSGARAADESETEARSERASELGPWRAPGGSPRVDTAG